MWAIIVLLSVGLFNMFQDPNKINSQKNKLPFSNFLNEVEAGRVVEVQIQGNNISGVLSDGKTFNTYSPNYPELVEKLSSKNVSIIATPLEDKMPSLLGILLSWFPMLLLIGVWIFFMRQMQGGKGGAMGFGKSKAKLLNEAQGKVTFNDVAGVEEAKEEVEEIVEFLKDPKKFSRLGGKIPKGALLIGPPGTGKTLLAKAIAGEANVPFFSISGSDFVEMFVGVGASRVRKLFEQAQKKKPCIIFIDEIDAVGRQRGAGLAGGNDEREQTLNQILTNMDGFNKEDGIIVLAATNRADILDNALTRPGRFDRKIKVGLPDYEGRKKIMDIHFKKKKIDETVDFDALSSLTSGFSGADIANLANEAAILSVRYNKTEIDKKCVIDAYEKITIGLPLLSREVEYDQEQLVAYHEAGHTMMALLFRDCFDVRKVTIKANTNGAGGYTLFTPKEKYFSYPTKKFLLSNLIVCMGGRAAEIILYNKILNINYNTNYTTSKLFDSINDLDITTGASADLKQADKLARQYIELFGIESNKDLTKTIQNPENPYISLSESTKSEIDNYVNRLVAFSLQKAIDILDQNMYSFNELANDLIEKKSVDIKYLNNIDVNFY